MLIAHGQRMVRWADGRSRAPEWCVYINGTPCFYVSTPLNVREVPHIRIVVGGVSYTVSDFPLPYGRWVDGSSPLLLSESGPDPIRWGYAIAEQWFYAPRNSVEVRRVRKEEEPLLRLALLPPTK